jgi:hypothetical protein
MSLHDSPFAMKESEEIIELQERLRFLQDIVNTMTDEDDLDEDFSSDFMHTLYALIEKQLIIVTRLKLSEDDVDKFMLETLNEDARNEGMPVGTDLYTYLLHRRRDILDKIAEMEGEDLDEPVDLD